ncbi:hypothetical protein VFPBJ_10694 [Purpureocillium lilacinum]|uniref:Uncharacterized protein n=1 Tax=Purpureocillium lilacinum TaxID=33203 RepID=A0A179FWF6_PURLI|nr:hypothetical protein VFPBJ_10694 [Purpureocillium lilacinum]
MEILLYQDSRGIVVLVIAQTAKSLRNLCRYRCVAFVSGIDALKHRGVCKYHVVLSPAGSLRATTAAGRSHCSRPLTCTGPRLRQCDDAFVMIRLSCLFTMRLMTAHIRPGIDFMFVTLLRRFAVGQEPGRNRPRRSL